MMSTIHFRISQWKAVFRSRPEDAIVASRSPTFETVTRAPTPRRPPGLLLRGGVRHIDKVIYGQRICEHWYQKPYGGPGASGGPPRLVARLNRGSACRQPTIFGMQRRSTARKSKRSRTCTWSTPKPPRSALLLCWASSWHCDRHHDGAARRHADGSGHGSNDDGWWGRQARPLKRSAVIIAKNPPAQ